MTESKNDIADVDSEKKYVEDVAVGKVDELRDESVGSDNGMSISNLDEGRGRKSEEVTPDQPSERLALEESSPLGSNIGTEVADEQLTIEEGISEPKVQPEISESSPPPVDAGDSVPITPGSGILMGASSQDEDKTIHIEKQSLTEPNAEPAVPVHSSTDGSGSLLVAPVNHIGIEEKQNITNEESKDDADARSEISAPSSAPEGNVHLLVAQYNSMKNKKDSNTQTQESGPFVDANVPSLVAQYDSMGNNKAEYETEITMNKGKKDDANENSYILEFSSSDTSLSITNDMEISTDNVEEEKGITIKEESKGDSNEIKAIDDESKGEQNEHSRISKLISSSSKLKVNAKTEVSTKTAYRITEDIIEEESESESESESSESLGSLSTMNRNSNGTFLFRLETSLITGVDLEVEHFNDEEVIDIEDFMDLKLEREKFRRDRHKKRKKKIDIYEGVDPRLFPSYYDQEEEEKIEDNDVNEDNFSIEDFDEDGDDVEEQQSSQESKAKSDVDPLYQVVSAIQGRKIVQMCVVPLHTKVKSSYKRRKASRMLEDAQTVGVVRGIHSDKDTTAFASPVRLLELENGQAILVRRTDEIDGESPTTMSVIAVRETTVPEISEAELLSIQTRYDVSRVEVRDMKSYIPESGKIEGMQRDLLRRRLVGSLDGVNALNLGRALQSSMRSLTGYESYLLGQVMEVLDATISDFYLLDHVTEVLDGVVSDLRVSGRTKKRMITRRKSEFNESLRCAFKSNHVFEIIVDNVKIQWDSKWHWFEQLRKIRWYDALGRCSILGITTFPASENVPGPAKLSERLWIQDPNKVTALSLGGDFHGAMDSIRSRFGTYIGRIKTNEFRVANRLSVDESIVHAFVCSPIPTMINNGVVHVLRQLSKHWNDILAEPFGNWSHHRMEQLNPFQTMRFHIPNVCIVLSSLRGRNVWDSDILSPFVCKCQKLTVSRTNKQCLDLIEEMQSNIVNELCAGVEAIENPLSSWLQAIRKSCDIIDEQAKEIYEKVTGVELGIRLGFDLITQVSWKIPQDKELDDAILLHVQGKYPGEIVNERNIRRALLALSPRSKRTLKGLVKLDEHKSNPAKALFRRARNLLKRDIRREFLNDAIQELSTGEHVFENNLRINDWYWLNEENEKRSVYIFVEEQTTEDGTPVYRFFRVDSGTERYITFDDPEASNCQQYIPVAEAIVRAQRCYMNLELDYCHQFHYNAFMEFSFLRTALKRLAVVSQIFCDDLDNARLNMLQEVKASNQEKVKAGDLEPGNTYYIHNSEFQVYAPFKCKKRFSPSDPEWKRLETIEMVKVPPQSMTVVGTNITGLMTAIHCTENVLASGGHVKLHESTDQYTREGTLFERAQIVRLDARWIAMLRYHLGSVFEDIFTPTPTETDSFFGNHSPAEGFVEISIKYLECILHAEVTRLMSKEIIEVIPGSNVQYDPEPNALIKFGEHLEVGDKILRHVDPNGKPSGGLHRWKITNVIYTKALSVKDLRIGEEYGVYINQEVLPFTLSTVDLQTRTYVFESKKKKVKNIEAQAHALPPVYPVGTIRQSETVFVTCENKGKSKKFRCDRLSETLKGQKFVIDVGHSHIIDCSGRKFDESSVHFEVTPSEPYGFCCITRLNGSVYGKPSRFVGGSSKLVRQKSIADEMVSLLKTERWQRHFEQLVVDSDFSTLNDKDPIFTKLVEAVEWHGKHASEFRRQNLQTQLFETGDNFYLGMELTREYEKWKSDTVENCLQSEKRRTEGSKMASRFLARSIEKLKEILKHNIDHLWFEASLEVLRRSGVYDSAQMPKIQLINSLIEQQLNQLSVGDNFREAGKMRVNFQLLFISNRGIFARTAEGMVRIFNPTTRVFREGALSRSTDNDSESKIAIATFPFSHSVNHRCIRLNNSSKGYVCASIGDAQSTSHFMRYTGLSGGCVNMMHFNNFVKAASDGVPLIERFRLYSKGTNWSNGEVIQKGTMTSFGQDSFLRPGFSYTNGLKYLRARIIELLEANEDPDTALSRSWKVKFAASMIPRGMELDPRFISFLTEETSSMIFDMFLKGVSNDELLKRNQGLEGILKARKDELSDQGGGMNHDLYWNEYVRGLNASFDDASMKRLRDFHCEVAKGMEQCVLDVIEFAKEAHLYNQRFNQELWNQPKSVDSIVGDFTLEARNYPNTLTLLVAFSAASVALCPRVFSQSSPEEYSVTISETISETFAFVLGVVSVFISFGILSSIGQYKNRNEQARAVYYASRYTHLKKTVFSAMDAKYRSDVALDKNDRRFVLIGTDPFLEDLERKKQKFLQSVLYYDLEDPDEFIYDYRRLLERSNQPEAYKHFQKLLVTYYLSDVYHINSHAQENLVEVNKVCGEIRKLLSQEDNNSRRGGKEQLPQFFDRISSFGDHLEQSLRPGLSSFFRRLQCCCSLRKESRVSSITKETLGIIKEAEIISKAFKGRILKRQILDLQRLHRASLEKSKADLVLILTSIVFFTSVIFVISTILKMAGAGNSVLTAVQFWSQLANFFAAFVPLFYFVRSLYKTLWLWVTLSAKIKSRAGTFDTKTLDGLRRIQSVASAHVFLTTLRFSAVLCAMVALPWAILLYAGRVGPSANMPLNIALVGFFQVVGSIMLSFLFEYVLEYNLPPNLGAFVYEGFQEEINSMHRGLSLSTNQYDTREHQERITWEYVAHEFFDKYRFDLILGADRFSSIFRYIQGGIVEEDKSEDQNVC